MAHPDQVVRDWYELKALAFKKSQKTATYIPRRRSMRVGHKPSDAAHRTRSISMFARMEVGGSKMEQGNPKKNLTRHKTLPGRL